MRGALLVAGTTSDAGKSALVAGICRLAAPPRRRGGAVQGAEHVEQLGRHARTAARSAGRRRCRPRPAGWRRASRSTRCCSSRAATAARRSWCSGGPTAPSARGPTSSARPRCSTSSPRRLADLRARYDVVVCEGAGSPAEINLRATDIANMGLAQAADLPVRGRRRHRPRRRVRPPVRHARRARPGRPGAGSPGS